MKKQISVLLVFTLLLAVLTLCGCSRKKDADLSDSIHFEYDRSVAVMEGKTLQSKDGNWRIVIHACTSRSDLTSRKNYFENTLTSIANQDVVSEEKTFGDIVFQTEYHTSGGKFAGSYFTVFDAPVKTKSILKPLYGIYCYVSAVDNSYIEEIETAMHGIYVVPIG